MSQPTICFRWTVAVIGILAANMVLVNLNGCVGTSTAPPPTLTSGDTDIDPGGGATTTGQDTSGSGGTGSGALDPCVQVGQPISSTHQDMFDKLNNYRVSKGLAPLAYSKSLETAANGHALDMYTRHFFDHTNPDGKGPLDRAVAAGFCRAQAIGENIAWNQPSVAEVQTCWQNSPGHNANMLNPDYRYVGMGYYLSPNGPYWVQLFGNVFPE